jgi:hypothetical protein
MVHGIKYRTGYTGNDHTQRNEDGYPDMEEFKQHFDTNKDQHNGDALLQVVELINSAAEQEEQ